MLTKKLFIHIPKNGGMTIRKSPLLSSKIIVASEQYHISKTYTQELHRIMKANNDHHGNEHARYQDLSQDIQSSVDAFAIIRNPWDRVVSRYFFAKKVIEVERKVDKSYADVSSFEAFLEERHKWGNMPYMWHRAVRGWYPALDHMTDTEGNLKCDVLSFENYNQDVCDYFGLKEMSQARNVTALNKGSYMDLYTPETIKIIADWYKADIDMFGYDFDGGPTKNIWRLENE